MDTCRLRFNWIVNGFIRANRCAPSAAVLDAARAAVSDEANRAANAVIVNRNDRHMTRDSMALHHRIGAAIPRI